MGLEKAIQSGKEKRRPYYGSKAIDSSCRNHGSCGWCRDSRLYQYRKKQQHMEQMEEDYDMEERI